MAYSAKILADSVSPTGHRLTSFEIVFPRLSLAELNTHRVFSRNSASSRAIPVKKQLERMLTEPFVPKSFGVNQRGMQASVLLTGKKHEEAVRAWLRGRDRAALTAFELLLGPGKTWQLLGSNPTPQGMIAKLDQLAEILGQAVDTEDPAETEILNVHKQLANRPLEPYMWHTVIVSATEWENFWGLRTDKEAQPEIRDIAVLMRELYDQHQPQELAEGEWHRPLIGFPGDEELKEEMLTPVSAGRCARITHLTHDGRRDPAADIALHDRLIVRGHISPCEHQARVMTKAELETRPWSGNFHGFFQYRKELPFESNFLLALTAQSQN